MARRFGDANSFNTVQYVGELFSADTYRTPLLSMIGGLSGGLVSDNEEFPTAVTFGYPEARVPRISEEDASFGARPSFIVREQETNVVQIFHESIGITYQRMSNTGRLAGVTTLESSAADVLQNELDFQIAQKLKVMARDVEFTFINGRFARRSSAAVANQTRGLIEACDVNAVEASGNALSKDMLAGLYRGMADNGAYFDDMVVMVNSAQKARLSEIYAQEAGFRLPATRTRAGVNILEVDNDFFRAGIVYSKFVPQDVLLIVDIAHVAPVFQTVPGKGNVFFEELSKHGAVERYQLYAQIGLAHGPGFLHGMITGLEV